MFDIFYMTSFSYTFHHPALCNFLEDNVSYKVQHENVVYCLSKKDTFFEERR